MLDSLVMNRGGCTIRVMYDILVKILTDFITAVIDIISNC